MLEEGSAGALKEVLRKQEGGAEGRWLGEGSRPADDVGVLEKTCWEALFCKRPEKRNELCILCWCPFFLHASFLVSKATASTLCPKIPIHQS